MEGLFPCGHEPTSSIVLVSYLASYMYAYILFKWVIFFPTSFEKLCDYYYMSTDNRHRRPKG